MREDETRKSLPPVICRRAVVCAAPAGEGYIYAPGYYQWDESRHQHVWTNGEYYAERRGEHYVPHRWTEQKGRYRFDEGRWEKDNKGQ